MITELRCHQATLLTYFSFDEEDLKEMDRKVYATLKSIQPATRAELARATGLSVQNMCWRIKELRERGKIMQGSIRPCKANAGSFAREWWVVNAL